MPSAPRALKVPTYRISFAFCESPEVTVNRARMDESSNFIVDKCTTKVHGGQVRSSPKTDGYRILTEVISNNRQANCLVNGCAGLIAHRQVVKETSTLRENIDTICTMGLEGTYVQDLFCLLRDTGRDRANGDLMNNSTYFNFSVSGFC